MADSKDSKPVTRKFGKKDLELSRLAIFDNPEDSMHWKKQTLRINFDPVEGRIIIATIFRGEVIGVWHLKDFHLWRDVNQFMDDLATNFEGAFTDDQYHWLTEGYIEKVGGRLRVIDAELWQHYYAKAHGG